MKINNRRDDFSKSDKVTVLHGCCSCCCCCFFWPGGLIGAAIGSSYTKPAWDDIVADPEKKPYLSVARKWFWGTIFISVLVGALFGLLGNIAGSRDLREIAQVVVWVLVLPAPALSFLIAAIVTGLAIRTRIPDKGVRELVNKRNTHILGGSLLGYAIGWVVVLIVMQ